MGLIVVLVAQSCPTLCDLMDCSCQAPLSTEFFRQEYCSGWPFPSPGDLPNPGIKPRSPALQAISLPSEPPMFKSINGISALKEKIPETCSVSCPCKKVAVCKSGKEASSYTESASASPLILYTSAFKTVREKYLCLNHLFSGIY
ncbi:unnamed protein product [Rangifer tarandus platyrhynchus]|uniref:Uncharacterized protein n=2 Tax=Rangifer tarandus platyrhynchus TaxID=3082113 RepID=A0ABN8ZVQ6_RANTA|nr:unnamed protein product [Rangifer tarandus platyrhynchus]